MDVVRYDLIITKSIGPGGILTHTPTYSFYKRVYMNNTLGTEDYDVTNDVGYSLIFSVIGEISVARTRMERKKRGGKIKACVEGELKTP